MKSQSENESPVQSSGFLEEAARALRLPRLAESPTRMALRLVAGFFFFAFGYVKFFDTIMLGTEAVSLPLGPTGFALYLEALGVPFPLLNAYMVCWLEMLCGAGLVLSPFLPAPSLLTRLCALPLMVDMVVAVITVGMPNLLGHPVLLNGIPVTAQVWRLPLELMLLFITLLLLWKPLSQVHNPFLGLQSLRAAGGLPPLS
jgi:putative oxidoreductase